jgi:hypothetical protein
VIVGARPLQKLRELVEAWYIEAGKYDVLPLDDRTARGILTDARPQPTAPRDRYVYYPARRSRSRSR